MFLFTIFYFLYAVKLFYLLPDIKKNYALEPNFHISKITLLKKQFNLLKCFLQFLRTTVVNLLIEKGIDVI